MQVSDDILIGSLPRTGGSVADGVLRHLQRLIVTGSLAPGERLAPERELAASLGVSRSALREALSRLEAQGLLERRQGRGTQVSDTVPLASVLTSRLQKDAVEFAAAAELRTVVEPQVARLAASRIDDTQLLSLADLVAESADSTDADTSVALDVAFHVGIAQATGNALLASLSELTVAWTVEARVYSHLEDSGRRLSHDGHTRILRALTARSADAAEAAMRVHLDEIADLIERVRTPQ